METPKKIAADYIDVYEDNIRRNPRTAVRKVMWLMIYDEQTAVEVRDYLEEVGIITKPEDEKARGSQMRKVHRWRTLAQESCGLPPRGKKGATTDYRRALQEWKRLNGRPTKEQLLAGWTPLALPSAAQAPVSPTPVKPVALTNPPHNPNPGKKPIPKPASKKQAREDSPEAIEHKTRKRPSVLLPPDYKPEDYLPKPPPPIKGIINGLPPKGAD